MLLPKKRLPALKKDPKRLLLFGSPKSGKTTIVSHIKDCLIVDMEEGSDYVESMSVKVNSLDDFKLLMNALKKAKDENGGKNPYRFIALDTLTALEELGLPLAKSLYMQTSMGANFKGKDVRTLPNGAGYLYTREAFTRMVKGFEQYCDTLILIGHVKEKDLMKNGESLTEKSINLTGKTKDIICAWCDTIGLVYREDNRTIINFAPSDNLVVGSRQKHLIGRKVVVATSDEENNLDVDWGGIFIEDETSKKEGI